MPSYVEGEVLPPTSPAAPLAVNYDDEQLNLVATVLDDMFQVPGTTIRFGFDALIGWIPGIGDALAAIASFLIIFAAWRRGAARITLVRMVSNVAIENSIGAIPILGDIAHVIWKSNRRNYNLLMRDRQTLRSHTWKDWLFVTGVALLVAILFLGPLLLLIGVLRSHFRVF